MRKLKWSSNLPKVTHLMAETGLELKTNYSYKPLLWNQSTNKYMDQGGILDSMHVPK